MKVARLQALTTLGWLACVIAWVVTYWASPGKAILGALVLSSGHAWVLGLEFLAQRRISRDDATPRATTGQLWRAWAAEVLTAPRLFCWHQPFRSRSVDDQWQAHAGVRGVVLVHGYVCNRGTWNPWMRRLQQQGRPFIAVNLEPVFGSIDDYVRAIEAAVTRLTQATGLPPLLVGHSMGGLAMRAWLRSTGDPHRVHRLVTLATPHHGTWLARYAHTPNARQMRPGHPWLEDLQRATPRHWHRHFVCFFSNADNIVFPPSHARLEGADARLLAGLAHVQLAWRPEVMQAVLALLESPPLPRVWPAESGA